MWLQIFLIIDAHYCNQFLIENTIVILYFFAFYVKQSLTKIGFIFAKYIIHIIKFLSLTCEMLLACFFQIQTSAVKIINVLMKCISFEVKRIEFFIQTLITEHKQFSPNDMKLQPSCSLLLISV